MLNETFEKGYFSPVGQDFLFHMNRQLTKDDFQVGAKLKCLQKNFKVQIEMRFLFLLIILIKNKLRIGKFVVKEKFVCALCCGGPRDQWNRVLRLPGACVPTGEQRHKS